MTPRSFVHDGQRMDFYAEGSGPALVFQHGLGGDAAQTFEAMPPLPGWRRVTLECRGHGGSDAGGVFSIAAFAADVAAMIVAECRPPVVLGGVSMGAAIASRIAVTRPELVRALILVRPAWVTEAAPANMAPNAEAGRLLAGLLREQAMEAFAASDIALGPPADNLASLAGFFSREPLDVTADLLQAISADGPGITPADLAALRLPALVMGCTDDAIHPVAHAERLAALIPGARLVEVPPKGRDKPAYLAAVQAAITTFLTELPDA